jgi:protein-tyrosine phosphatase
VHLPVSGWTPPTNAQIAQFLSIFRDNPQDKVFVHCRYGEDRTGVFIATYRMTFEKLPADQALKEMYYFGFNGFWHPSMAVFVRDFPARLTAAPAFAAFKNQQ